MRYNITSIILLFFIFGCGNREEPQTVLQEQEADVVILTNDQVKNAGVGTGKVEKHLLNSELKVNGQVDVPPQNIVSVSFAMGGYLRHTRLMPGMHIRRGEVIATMEDPALVQLQQDYLVAVARLQYLQKDFERQKLLNEKKVNADKVYQRAESDFAEQKVLVRGYAEKLRLIHINPDKLNEMNISRTVAIYSPINGFVSKVNVNIGKYVNPADVLFELINPGDMHAALTVFEKDISKVKAGQKVLVSFVSEPSVEYECEVVLVTKSVDNDRSALVHCHFKQQPGQLLPGMFLNARIQNSEISVLAVPDEAVVRYGSSEYVLVAEGSNKYRLTAVTTGIKNDSLVEVSSGIANLEGLDVIVKNPYPVLSAIKNTSDE